MNAKVDLAKASGVWDTLGYTKEIEALIDLATKAERERCLVQVDREGSTWKTSGSARAVRTACEHIKIMIRGEM